MIPEDFRLAYILPLKNSDAVYNFMRMWMNIILFCQWMFVIVFKYPIWLFAK